MASSPRPRLSPKLDAPPIASLPPVPSALVAAAASDATALRHVQIAGAQTLGAQLESLTRLRATASKVPAHIAGALTEYLLTILDEPACAPLARVLLSVVVGVVRGQSQAQAGGAAAVSAPPPAAAADSSPSALVSGWLLRLVSREAERTDASAEVVEVGRSPLPLPLPLPRHETFVLSCIADERDVREAVFLPAGPRTILASLVRAVDTLAHDLSVLQALAASRGGETGAAVMRALDDAELSQTVVSALLQPAADAGVLVWDESPSSSTSSSSPAAASFPVPRLVAVCKGLVETAGLLGRSGTTSAILLGLLLGTETLHKGDVSTPISSAALASRVSTVRSLLAGPWYAALRPLPRTAVARGLLVNAATSVLLAPGEEAAGQGVAGGSSASLLEGLLLMAVDDACRHSDAGVRLMGVTGLETWVRGATRCCLAAASAATNASTPSSSSSPAVSSESLRLVLSHVMANWTHPLKRISAVVTIVFEQLLDLLAAAEGAGGGTAAAPTTAGAAAPISSASLLRLVLAQPRGQLARYGALARMLPRVGAGSMLAECPTLVDDVFAACCLYVDSGSVAGTFLSALATVLRQESERAVGLGPGSAGGSGCPWVRAKGAPERAQPLGPSSSQQTGGEDIAAPSAAAAASAASAAPGGGKRPSKTKVAKDRKVASAADRAAVEATVRACGLGELAADAPEGLALGADRQPTPAAIAAAVAAAVAGGRLPAPEAPVVEHELLHATAYRRWCYGLWLRPLVAALLHPVREVRVRSVQHALRVLVPLDPASGPVVLRAIRAYRPVAAPPAVDVDAPGACPGDDLLSLAERKVWGALQVGIVLRLASWPVLECECGQGEGAADGGRVALLTSADLAAAACSPDADTRLAVLDLLTGTSGGTSLPTPFELDRVYEWLSAATKPGLPDTRKRIGRALTFFVDRILLGLYAATREAGKGADGVSAAAAAASVARVDAARLACSSFVRKTASLCLACLYPGATYDRTGLALELLDMMTAKIGIGEGASATVGPALASALAVVATQPAVASLLNLATSTFDRVRTVASNILARLPATMPLPGYASPADVAPLFAWAVLLTQSPRDRESAAGASILRILHRCYVVRLGWRVTFPSTVAAAAAAAAAVVVEGEGGEAGPATCLPEDVVIVRPAQSSSSPSSSPVDAAGASRAFISSLLALFRARMAAFGVVLESMLGVEGAAAAAALPSPLAVKHSPLGHGLVAALRLILADLEVSAAVAEADAGTSAPGTGAGAGWRESIADVLDAVRKAQTLALSVVAGVQERDADSGGPDGGGTGSAAKPLLAPVSNSVSELRQDIVVPGLDRDINALTREAGAGVDELGAGFDGPEMGGAEGGGDGDEDGGADDDGDADGSPSASTSTVGISRMIVVASWLLTRECCLLQGELVGRLPLPAGFPSPAAAAGAAADTLLGPLAAALEVSTDAPGAPWLLSSRQVALTGTLLIRSLITVKHHGSIHNAAEALQLMATRLLSLPAPPPPSSPSSTLGPSSSSLPHISRLPSLWLEALLARLEGASATQFILRRSAGFAAAFLAILRGEPRAAPPLLLRRTMVVLLRLAGADPALLARDIAGLADAGESAEGSEAAAASSDSLAAPAATSSPASSPASWRTAVHALNILRLLFRDAALGDGISAFTTSALRTALVGFKSRAWAVRNSSTMLYAAIVDRAVGSSQAAAEGLGLGLAVGSRSRDRDRPTLAQFFARYPSLAPFLADELAAGSREGADEASSLTLFPALLLLARLKPLFADTTTSGAALSEAAGDDGGAAIPAPVLASLLASVRACTRQRHAYVRRAAARAVPSLLAPGQAGGLVVSLAAAAASALQGGSALNNESHGTLLQLRVSILCMEADGACRLAVEEVEGSGAAALAVARTALAPFSTPATFVAARPVGLVSAALLDTVRTVEDVAARVRGGGSSSADGALSATHPLTLSLARDGLEAGRAADASAGSAFALGGDLLAEACADALVTAAMRPLLSGLGPASSAALDDVRLVLVHPQEEARVAGARALKRALKHADRHAPATGTTDTAVVSAEDQQAALGLAAVGAAALARALASSPSAASLLPILLGRIADEAHPRARKMLVRALDHLTAALPPAALRALATGEARTWTVLLRAFDVAREPAGRAAATTLLARLCGPLVADAEAGLCASSDPVDVASVVPAVAARLERSAADHASFRVRHAAVRGFRTAGVARIALGTGRVPQPPAPTGDRTASLLAHLSAATTPVWSSLLAVLVDFDDEVREEARACVADAAAAAAATAAAPGSSSSSSSGSGSAPAAGSVADLLGKLAAAVRPVLAPLLPPPLVLPADGSLSSLVLDEGRAFILAHGLLLAAAVRSGRDGRETHAVLVTSILADRALAVLERGPDAVRAAAEEAAAAGGPSSRHHPLADTLPFDTRMLTRVMFPPDNANDYAEPLVNGGLAAASWRVLALFAKGVGEPAAAAAAAAGASSSPAPRAVVDAERLTSLLSVSSQITAAASGVDVGNVLDPVVGEACPWIAGSGGVDDSPEVFAAARVAEGILA
jgi:hypothetical protein